MSRVQTEKKYWDNNALDPDVDEKYISDVDADLCKQDLRKLKGRVLEIGCGVGRLLEDDWWGIDTSENMVNIAKQRGHENVLLSDGRTIPFTAESFDSVYSYLVFQHLPKDAVQGYIKEAYRVLKDGGELVFQFIEGDEDEPFSKHLKIDEVLEFTSDFTQTEIIQSVAYSEWKIARCKK